MEQLGKDSQRSAQLFDLLGRVATCGIWAFWGAFQHSDEEKKQRGLQHTGEYESALKALIPNNPALLLPLKDDQAIDVSIAVLLLALDENNHDDVRHWLAEMLGRARFAYWAHSHYPCILRSYSDLLPHPKSGDNDYRKNVTSGSILYPIISLWGALLNDDETYSKVADFKRQHLQHCNFQFWYPDEGSESHFYVNDDFHGVTLSDVCVERTKEELLTPVFGECDQSPHFTEMSAIKLNLWPLVVVACRHYRLPLPLHLLEGLRTR